MTLSIVLLDLLYADEQKDHYHPLLYAGCMLGLFYTKQYFVLLVIVLCVYLFSHSKKDLKKLIAYGILPGCLSIVVVYFPFPLYFSEVFPITHGQTITGDPSYSLMQVIRLSIYYAPIVLLALIGIVLNLHDMIRHKHISNKLTYDFCQIIFVFVPLFFIAENQGTNYTYYLQLWYPYIILHEVLFSTDALKHLNQKCVNLICLNAPKTFFPVLGSVLACLLIAFSLLKVMPSYRCIALVYTGEYHLTDDDLINAGYRATASEYLTSGTQCWHTVFYTTEQSLTD